MGHPDGLESILDETPPGRLMDVRSLSRQSFEEELSFRSGDLADEGGKENIEDFP